MKVRKERMSIVYCSKCGEKNNVGSTFCKKCGARIKNTINESSQGQQLDNKSKGNRKKIIIFIVLAVILLAVIGTIVYIYNSSNKKNSQDDTVDTTSVDELVDNENKNDTINESTNNDELVDNEEDEPEYEFVKIYMYSNEIYMGSGNYIDKYYDCEGKNIEWKYIFGDTIFDHYYIYDKNGYETFGLVDCTNDEYENTLIKYDNDNSGNIIRTVNFHENASVESIINSIYDENNNLIKETYSNGDDVTTYVYDENKNLIEKESVRDEKINKWIYKYDENNNCIYQEQVGKYVENIEYKYDADNNIIYRITYSDDEKNIESFYVYENGLCISRTDNRFESDGSKKIIRVENYDYVKCKKHEHNLAYIPYELNMHKAYCTDEDCDYYVFVGCSYDNDVCDLCGENKEDIYFNNINIYEIDNPEIISEKSSRIDIKDYHESVPSVWFDGTLEYELASGINDSKPMIISDEWDDVSYIYNKAIEIRASDNGDGYSLKWSEPCDYFSIYGLYIGMSVDEVKKLAQKDNAKFDGRKYTTSESSKNNEYISLEFNDDKIVSILFEKQVY